MSATAEFPALSFTCPKLWAQMAGNEKKRFCEVCQKNVHNLSLMTQEERQTLLASTGESPCVAYFKHVNGTPIDVTALPEGSPLKKKLTKAALMSMSAVALSSITINAVTLLEMAIKDPEAPTTGKGGCGNHMMIGMVPPPPGYLPPPLPPGWPGPKTGGQPGGLPPSGL
jgi:hypothetical protein